MGQKTNPIGFRLIRNRNWKSKWFANKKEFGTLLVEDQLIRSYLLKKPICLGTSQIKIRRMSEKIEVTIYTARPGLVIGKKGAEIDTLKQELFKLTGKEVWIEVEEVKRPDLDAKIVADGIAKQLERRIPYRRALKKAIQASIDAGALGVKIKVSGRIGELKLLVQKVIKKVVLLYIHCVPILITQTDVLKQPMVASVLSMDLPR